MKKILKSLNIFLIAVLLSFIFTNQADAANCEGKSASECRYSETRGGELKVGDSFTKPSLNKYKYSSIGVTDSVGNVNFFVHRDYNNIALYCIDAHLNAMNYIKLSRFLLNPNDSKHIQAYDYAVMYVMTNGGKDIITNPDSNLSEYFSRLAAQRALSYVFENQTKANGNYAFYTVLTSVDTWLKKDSSGYDAMYSALQKYGEEGYLRKKDSFGGYPGYNYSGSPVDKAGVYFNEALKAAAAYISNLTPNQEAKVETLAPVEKEKKVSELSNGVFIERDIVHTINVSGIPKNETNSISIDGLSLVGKYDGLTAYISSIKVGNREFDKDQVKIILTKNLLLDFDFTNETKIEITVHMEGWQTSENSSIKTLTCGQSPINYHINGKYTTGSTTTGLFSGFIGMVWHPTSAGWQKYFSVEKGTGTEMNTMTKDSWSQSFGTSLIEACSCEDLAKACKESGDTNSEACKTLEQSNCGDCVYLESVCEINSTSKECDQDKYTLTCGVNCNVTYTKFECCNAEGELIVSELDDREVKILGPGPDNEESNDIKACFVTKLDAQCHGSDPNNTSCAGTEGVKDQKDNVYTLKEMKQNKYCTVSCKEDYIMTMPTAKMVNAGRYFTFKAKIEGTKTCYTNTIDRDQYNKDIKAAQIRLVNAYNEYLRTKTASETAIETKTSSCCSACGGTYESYYLNSTSAYSYGYKDNGPGGITVFVKGGLSYSDSSVGGSSCPRSCCTPVVTSKGTTIVCSCSHCSYCNSGNKSTVEQNVKNAFNAAKNELTAAQENYEKIIKEFDSCSNWDTEINYDPEVYYDYNENYMNQFNHVGEMDADVKVNDSIDWYCNSSITSLGQETRKGEISDKDYNVCNSGSTDYKTTEIEYTYCTTSGCSIKKVPVSNARYKKVTSEVKANYKPKTLFYNIYPTGEITINKEDNNKSLENQLPVSLGTKRGIHQYTVNVKDLGEFYDQTNKLGRYVGSTSKAVVAVEKLIYNCAYLVNITEKNGWCCAFEENCGDHCIANCYGPNCDEQVCNGEDCIADCVGVGCIYDSGAGSSLFEKVISLNNMFPTGTDSYNWTNQKGENARNEIEAKGNNVYGEKPILSLTINSSAAAEIRKYNKEHLNQGGYSYGAMTCEEKDGYERIACFSEFISDILNGSYGDVVNVDNSLIADSSYRSVNSDYFRLYNGSNISEKLMIGPSYR